MRYKILAVGTFVVGYIFGSIYGYRAAVVDYVENDAQTIRQMAETMYETASEEEVPEELQKVMMEANSDDEDESDESSASAFQ